MDDDAIAKAADLLADLRQGAAPVADLGETGPATIADGHRVQDELIRRLGESVAGWKVTGVIPGEVMRGAVIASRLVPSGTAISPADAPLLGIEAEIAFRVDRDLPSGNLEWTREQLADYLTALPVIEIVATRFADYQKAPPYHRLADMMSNGFLVAGMPQPDWRTLDLATIGVRLEFDGAPVKIGRGGHTAGDPLRPVLALVNSGRIPPLRAGQIVTTGTYTGLLYAEPGMSVSATFEGLGSVEVDVARQ